MQAITIGTNNLGHKQAYDEEGGEVCSECGRCHKNFGNGIMCCTCVAEEEMYWEWMWDYY
jgi:hypothetical protein